jgi:UDP-glucose 4-epimerase
VYGNGGKFKKGLTINEEDDPISITSTHSHYALSKLINEMMAASYQSAGVNCLGLRIFNAYGTGDELKAPGKQAPPTWMRIAKERGEPIVIYGDGTQDKDFIHVSDVVEIIMRLIESQATGIVNVGTGVATSFSQLADLIGGETYTIKMLPIPDPASYQYFTRADTTRLLSIIGPYKFKSIEEGLRL